MRDVFSTHQAVYESHAQSVGSLVQFHYKHHTQVIREGRGARGGHRERKLTPTNTPCRGHGHAKPQKHTRTNTHTHTHKGSRYGAGQTSKVLLCRTQTHTQILRRMQLIWHTNMCFCMEPADVTLSTPTDWTGGETAIMWELQALLQNWTTCRVKAAFIDFWPPGETEELRYRWNWYDQFIKLLRFTFWQTIICLHIQWTERWTYVWYQLLFSL